MNAALPALDAALATLYPIVADAAATTLPARAPAKPALYTPDGYLHLEGAAFGGGIDVPARLPVKVYIERDDGTRAQYVHGGAVDELVEARLERVERALRAAEAEASIFEENLRELRRRPLVRAAIWLGERFTRKARVL